MQTGLLPGNDPSSRQLERLQDDDHFNAAADTLWGLLLNQLRRRVPKSRKGKRSHCLCVTKEDIMHVRMSSRRSFWERARAMDNEIAPSGGLLFWNCVHALMQGDSPRVKMEDNAIFAAPNTKGYCKVWAFHPSMLAATLLSMHCIAVPTCGDVIAIVATKFSCRALFAKVTCINAPLLHIGF